MRNGVPQSSPAGWRCPLVGLLLLAACTKAPAQSNVAAFTDFFSESVCAGEQPFRFDLRTSEAVAPSHLRVVRFFSMPSAIPVAPLGLDQDDDLANAGTDAAVPDDGRVQVVLGTENPFYDFRRPGNPGGAGYYRFYSQALLFDNSQTAFSLGFDATTPAGLESEGIARGPTYFSPNCAWLYDVVGGNSFSAFLGQDLRARTHWNNGFTHTSRYGLAWQSPCPGLPCDQDSCVHFFVEALGRFRYDGVTTQRSSRNWEFIPGVQWRLGERWWLSGGYLFPLGTTNAENRVQLNCTWRF